MHTSIPLDKAWIRWGSDQRLEPPIRVIEVGEEIDNRYYMSWGCASGDFQLACPEQRVTLLFAKAMELILYHGYESKIVHRALLPIREYRANLLSNLVPERWRQTDRSAESSAAHIS